MKCCSSSCWQYRSTCVEKYVQMLLAFLLAEGIGYKLRLADGIFQSTKSSVRTQGNSWCQSICPVSFKKRTASGSKGSAAGSAGPRVLKMCLRQAMPT